VFSAPSLDVITIPLRIKAVPVPMSIGNTMKGKGVKTMTERGTTANERERDTKEGGMSMRMLAEREG